MKIVSSRGRSIKERQESQKRLEEKFLGGQSPLTDEERARVEKIFDTIRRQLNALGRGGWACLTL